MTNNVLYRRVDQLGRIVLPMELRRRLKINEGTRLCLTVNDETIVLKKVEMIKSVINCVKNCVKCLPEEVKLIICDNEKVICASAHFKHIIGCELLNSMNALAYSAKNQRLCDCIKGEKEEANFKVVSIVCEGDRHGFVLQECDEKSTFNADYSSYIAKLIEADLC